MEIQYSKTIEIRYQTDILVVGGGPAGVAAAVTAARAGKRVFLAECEECFGGAGVVSKVPAFMRFSDGVDFLCGGIGKEIFEMLYGNNQDYTQIELPIDTEKLKLIYDELVTKSGAEFLFETKLVDVICKDGTIQYAIMQGKEQLFGIEAKVFIDATGNGTLAVMAGADYEKGDDKGRMMPATLCSLWGGIDWDKAIVELGKDPDNRFLKQAIQDGVFTVPDMSLPGMWHLMSDYGGGNIGHIFGTDGTDEKSVTDGMIQARKRMGEYEYYYNHYLDGYENAHIISTGDVLGIRETRRIICEYMASKTDYTEYRVFEDEIGRYCYPIDIHSAVANKKDGDSGDYTYPRGKSYGISYKSLIPKKLNNLLVAGRCMGAERSMMGSLRVMPACFITGMASGMAAALAVEKNGAVREINTHRLLNELKTAGAYLPNYK